MELSKLIIDDTYSEDEVYDVILKEVCKLTKRKGYVSTIYNSSNSLKFKPGRIDSIPELLTLSLKIKLLYEQIDELSRSYPNFHQTWLGKEFDFIDKRGLHCVYFSLVTKVLAKSIYNIDLDLVQGFYRFKNNAFVSMIFGEYSTGYHSWCSYNDKVIDCTFVEQQQTSYTTRIDTEIFFGMYPNDITLVGFKESEEVVKKYLKMFLSPNQYSVDTWIQNFRKLLEI